MGCTPSDLTEPPRRDGPLFRGRYKAIVVEAEAYVAAVIRYIHLNPVQARMVKSPEAYAWSSHASYLKPRKVPPWLAVGEVLREYGPPREFHEFVLGGNEEAIEAFYAAKRQMPVLGTEGFRRRLQKVVRKLSREHPRYERAQVRPTVKQVVKAVGKVFGGEEAVLQSGRRGVANVPRKVAMYLVKRLCDLTLEETAKQFGLNSYGVVGWACAQVRAQQVKDRRFGKRVEQVEVIISQQKT